MNIEEITWALNRIITVSLNFNLIFLINPSPFLIVEFHGARVGSRWIIVTIVTVVLVTIVNSWSCSMSITHLQRSGFPKKQKKFFSKWNSTREKQEDSRGWLIYWVGRLRNAWIKMQIILNTPHLKVTMFFQSSYEMVSNFFFSIFHFFFDK